jgi:hypothetical protein
MGGQVIGYGWQVTVYGRSGLCIWYMGNHLWDVLKVAYNPHEIRFKYPFMGQKKGNRL